MSYAAAVDSFLRLLGIKGEEQDTVDLAYLQDVHWEEWQTVSWKINC